jgi:DNA-binding NarL/FixJ family response regulator
VGELKLVLESANPSPPGLETLQREASADGAALIALESDGRRLKVVASSGCAILAPRTALGLDVCTKLAEACGAQPALLATTVDESPLDVIGRVAGIQTRMIVSLCNGESALGALELLWHAPERFANVERSLVERATALVQAHRGMREGVIFVCHESPLMAAGLAREIDYVLPGATQTAFELPDMVAKLPDISHDLVVCSDRISPGVEIGDVARAIRECGTAAPFIVVARIDSVQSFDAAVAAGASGFLPLATAHERIADAAIRVLTGSSFFDPSGPSGDSGPRLTRREHEVLLACERGLSHKEIADELDIAVSTAKSHARAMYAKLNATTRTQALHNARGAGLLD